MSEEKVVDELEGQILTSEEEVMDEPEEKLLDVDGLMKALKVKRSWVYDKTRRKGSNTIPKFRVGKHLRFKLSEVLEWSRG